jgi:hydrogenase nickel incorporation protein HypA/HybF
MHELSVSAAVVDTAVRHAAGRPVTVVRLRVGALRQVVPDSLEFYFGIVARDTVCEGARLEQELIEARLRCAACETEWEVDLPAFRCPVCDGADVAVVCGEELEVESIDVETEEVTPCIA